MDHEQERRKIIWLAIFLINFFNLESRNPQLIYLKKKVLIAENDEDIRHLVSFILESQGYEVRSCPYTLENLLGMEADLILLDEWINLKEGPMLCKEIKAIERLAHVPVIIFSTAADIEQIAASCQARTVTRTQTL